MPTTISKATERHLAALRNRLIQEQSRLERLLGEVEAALGKRQEPEMTSVTVPPRPSPLDSMKETFEATRDLRVANGNLSAERIASLYGVSLSQLAAWLGKSRQAVNKTPDADSLQPALAYFEHVARLRLALEGDQAFRKWLRTSQDVLEDESPLELMAQGEWQVVADYVDDMLTGAPA